MFEDSTHFDLDDGDVLGTSFTPASSSTQTYQIQKRNSEEPVTEISKKVKLTENEHLFFKKDKSIDVPFSSPNRFVKRKFPGPAGLLPERTKNNKSILELIASEHCTDSNDNRDQMILCSQQTASTFEDGPWKEMTKDFPIYNGEYLYEKFNIKWIKKQASLKKLLINHKAPFLAAIIQSLEIFDGKVPTVNITLKDATDDIQGTILHTLYEEYSDFLTVGSVLVLKQFGVLSAGYNNHCLTITPNNLLTIYCLEVPRKLPEDGSTGSTEGFNRVKNGPVKKIVVQNITLDEILTKYNEDVLANSEQKQRGINFGNLNQNYGRFLKNNSDITNHGATSYDKFKRSSQLSNVEVPKSRLQFQKRPVSESSVTTIGPPKPPNEPPNDNVKKKFNFKESVGLQKCYHDSSRTAMPCDTQSKCTGTQKSSSENKSDNILINSSQISVKPARKEHTEIWKNLLQDVDTDSLFDDF